MSNTNLIKELRALTQAGMKDCKDALDEANGDLEKAVDIVKKKGLNIVSGREGKVASEGMVVVSVDSLNGSRPIFSMAEVNCQTDFVANSDSFKEFARSAVSTLAEKTLRNQPFSVQDVEISRQSVVSTTKENVVLRRWWVEQALDPKAVVFKYVHSNNKIGVLLTLLASSEDITSNPKFEELGNDLVMQIAAMNPAAVSAEKLPQDLVNRQNAIFESQLKEMNKPESATSKILEGKRNKWYTEVCLLEQESVVYPKTTIKQVIKNFEALLNCKLEVVNFIRCQVGEGLETSKTLLSEEVSKML